MGYASVFVFKTINYICTATSTATDLHLSGLHTLNYVSLGSGVLLTTKALQSLMKYIVRATECS